MHNMIFAKAIIRNTTAKNNIIMHPPGGTMAASMMGMFLIGGINGECEMCKQAVPGIRNDEGAKCSMYVYIRRKILETISRVESIIIRIGELAFQLCILAQKRGLASILLPGFKPGTTCSYNGILSLLSSYGL